MPELANLVYNMYMHMIQNSQKYRQVRAEVIEKAKMENSLPLLLYLSFSAGCMYKNLSYCLMAGYKQRAKYGKDCSKDAAFSEVAVLRV